MSRLLPGRHDAVPDSTAASPRRHIRQGTIYLACVIHRLKLMLMQQFSYGCSDLQPTFMPSATGSSSTSGVTAGITEYFIPKFYFEDEMAEEEEEVCVMAMAYMQFAIKLLAA